MIGKILNFKSPTIQHILKVHLRKSQTEIATFMHIFGLATVARNGTWYNHRFSTKRFVRNMRSHEICLNQIIFISTKEMFNSKLNRI